MSWSRSPCVDVAPGLAGGGDRRVFEAAPSRPERFELAALERAEIDVGLDELDLGAAAQFGQGSGAAGAGRRGRARTRGRPRRRARAARRGARARPRSPPRLPSLARRRTRARSAPRLGRIERERADVQHVVPREDDSFERRSHAACSRPTRRSSRAAVSPTGSRPPTREVGRSRGAAVEPTPSARTARARRPRASGVARPACRRSPRAWPSAARAPSSGARAGARRVSTMYSSISDSEKPSVWASLTARTKRTASSS